MLRRPAAGTSCGHDRGPLPQAAKLALIVAVPVTLLQLVVGNRFGEAVTSAQSMKIAASEAQWNTCQPCGFSLFQIGGFTESDQTPELLDHDPEAPLVHGHRLVRRPGRRASTAPDAGAEQYGRGNYMPNVRVDLLVDAGDGLRGSLMFLVAVGRLALLEARARAARWFLDGDRPRSRSRTSPRRAGWILTEMGASRGSCRAAADQRRRTRPA
jgi:cytochrome d ubiquinol oxidase subunit I